MSSPSPRWTREQLEHGLLKAKEQFRQERMQEPLEAYLDAFDRYHGCVENLLKASIDLVQLESTAVEILTQPDLLEAFRYLAGPPLSADDLKTVSEAVLSPTRLRSDPAMVRRIVDIVRIGLDRRRFPWIAEGREPTAEERGAAVLASAVLMATSRVSTGRRSESKNAQEQHVEDALTCLQMKKVGTRNISTLNLAPRPGEFCREAMLGERKADFTVGLWDHRIMAIECKVSNSSTNSVKRLNNDAAVKAEIWYRDFGTKQIVPVALLSGVYKIHNLESAQNRGLTLFWAHDLAALTAFIAQTKA